MSLISLLLVIIALAPVLSAPTADELVITLPDGQIQGATYSTPTNVTYYGWRGIPFGAPPIGNLRFEAPQPPQPWTGILDATQDKDNCLSVSSFGRTLSEDCLYLNVYTSSLKPTDKLPVLFWIYGGGFQAGGGDKTSYGPDYFMEEDVILVTSNYRLGPFGFLSTGDTAIRGNAGLKDQVMAMKWTKNNIALFGGDPEKITIFGESAGGMSVGLQLLSKQSKGLFRAAIVESGSAVSLDCANVDPLPYALQLGGYIPGGNYGNDTQKLADFLKNCTGDEIIQAANMVPGMNVGPKPVVEVEGDEAFLSEYPFVMYENRDFHEVPIIIGICAEEGLTAIDDLTKVGTDLDSDPKSIIPLNLRPNASDEDIIADKIKSMYIQEEATFLSNLTGLVKYQTDNNFARAVIKNAELHSRYVSATYLYQFAFSTTPAAIDGVEAAAHGSEVKYLFNSPNHPGPPIRDDTETIVQKRMVKLWTNFATFLNPTPEKSELLQNVIWPSVTPSDMQFLNINGTLEVRQDLKGDIYRLWNETFYTYGAKPFITF